MTQQEIARMKHGLNMRLKSRHTDLSKRGLLRSERLEDSVLEETIQSTFDVANNFTLRLGKKFSDSIGE